MCCDFQKMSQRSKKGVIIAVVKPDRGWHRVQAVPRQVDLGQELQFFEAHEAHVLDLVPD